MNPELDALLDLHGGVVTRTEAAQVMPLSVLERACRAGHLRRVLPGVYVNPNLDHSDPGLFRLAAVRYADGRGVLSHTTALDLWGIQPASTEDSVHLTVPPSVRLRSAPMLAVHHHRSSSVAAIRAGLPVTSLEESLVYGWPLLPPDERHAAVMAAVTGRRTTPDRIADIMACAPKIPDRAALRVLLDRLAAGCHSPLELWGHDHVFTGKDLPQFHRQVRIGINGRAYYLDVFAELERVDFELDGAAFHSTPTRRESDLRRDAALATLGIQVVRFTTRRLRQDTDRVRAEIRTILAARSHVW